MGTAATSCSHALAAAQPRVFLRIVGLPPEGAEFWKPTMLARGRLAKPEGR